MWLDTCSIKLTREELYDMVWSKPLRELANELGLSDKALAKRCMKLDIPTPGQGYWLKKNKPQKEELPYLDVTQTWLTHFPGPKELRKEKERQFELECLEQEQEEELAMLEETLKEDLEAMVCNWVRAKHIREFIQTVEQLPLESPYSEMEKSEWLIWASNYANKLDPCQDGNISKYMKKVVDRSRPLYRSEPIYAQTATPWWFHHSRR